MSKRISCANWTARIAVGVALVAGLAVAAAEAGPVNIISTHREVNASVEFEQRPGVFDTKSSNDVGPFDAVALAEDAGDDFAGSVRASVDSSDVGQDGFHYTGNLGFTVREGRDGLETQPGHLVLSFRFEAEFAIDTPYAYDFRATLSETGLGNVSQGEEEFQLLGPGPIEILADRSGVLEPGTYTLRVNGFREKGGFSPEEQSYSGDYDVSLDLSPVGGGGGQPNPVPLPPAAWTGLAALAIGALPRVRRTLLGFTPRA